MMKITTTPIATPMIIPIRIPIPKVESDSELTINGVCDGIF